MNKYDWSNTKYVHINFSTIVFSGDFPETYKLFIKQPKKFIFKSDIEHFLGRSDGIPVYILKSGRIIDMGLNVGSRIEDRVTRTQKIPDIFYGEYRGCLRGSVLESKRDEK